MAPCQSNGPIVILSVGHNNGGNMTDSYGYLGKPQVSRCRVRFGGGTSHGPRPRQVWRRETVVWTRGTLGEFARGRVSAVVNLARALLRTVIQTSPSTDISSRVGLYYARYQTLCVRDVRIGRHTMSTRMGKTGVENTVAPRQRSIRSPPVGSARNSARTFRGNAYVTCGRDPLQ